MTGITKEQERVQKRLREMDEIQRQLGGRSPEYINMYFAAKLERLTKVLACLTAILALLTIVQIILLVWGKI